MQNQALHKRRGTVKCSFQKILHHRATTDRQEPQFFLRYTRCLYRCDGVSAANDYLRTAPRGKLGDLLRVMDVALFVDASWAIPENEFCRRDVGAKHCDGLGSHVDDAFRRRYFTGLFHQRVPALGLDRHVDRREKVRIRENIIAGKLFRDQRAADGKAARPEHVVRKGACDKDMVVFLQEKSDERRLRLELGAAKDGERRMFGRACRVYLMDLVAHEESRV